MTTQIFMMDSAKKGALKVYDGMTIVFPILEKEISLKFSDVASKFNGCYAMNNSTVCFINENETFVAPYTKALIQSLHSANFIKKDFYVPFSNGDYPKAEQDKWNTLLKMARKADEDDFIIDCNKFCDEHYIGSISEETLNNCFEMPSTGVLVNHHSFENCYYPIINTTCLDCIAVEKIGHFCANNGKVVFVYRNGKTYVARGYKILDELRDKGYTETSLFVPFSNGEEIKDAILRKRWESLKKFS